MKDEIRNSHLSMSRGGRVRVTSRNGESELVEVVEADTDDMTLSIWCDPEEDKDYIPINILCFKVSNPESTHAYNVDNEVWLSWPDVVALRDYLTFLLGSVRQVDAPP